MPDDREESPAARKRREKEEFLSMARDAEALRREKARHQAQENRDIEEISGDDALVDWFRGEFGEEIDDIRKEADRMGDRIDQNTQDAISNIYKYRIKNPGKAKKIAKKNKKKIGEVAKSSKQNKGGFCGVITLALIAGLSAIGYGMYEGVTAIASALW